MKLYKDNNGRWRVDEGIVPAGACFLRKKKNVVEIYFLDGRMLYQGAVTRITRENGTPYEDIETFNHEVGDFFVKAPAGGGQELLGGIAHNAAAPTPGLSGKFYFTTSGAVSWLTGTPTVSVGDEVIVVFAEPDAYQYTLVPVTGTYELVSRKQNSLLVDGTGAKYPTVDAINAKNNADYEPLKIYMQDVVCMDDCEMVLTDDFDMIINL